MDLGRSMRLPAGLRLLPADPRAAIRATAIAILVVCAWIAAIDFAFRPMLPQDYMAHYAASLWPRTAWACLGSMREELLFRLGMMTLLAAVPALFGLKPGDGWMVAVIVLAQLANVGTLVLAYPVYGALRLWLVGCVWGWLYWRHGFASALAGHGLSHLLLDPLLFLVHA